MWDKKYHVMSSMGNRQDGYAMFLGRWQPLHQGHKQLFQQALDAGQKICIMIRDMPPDEKNIYPTNAVFNMLAEYFHEEMKTGKVIVLVVPNITSINFGRGVGYDIIEHIPPADVAEISATKIREQGVCKNT